MQKLFLLFLALLTACFCSYSQQETNTNKTQLNILFIGNSLTYSNDLPQLVVKEGLKNKIKISTKMIALPNYSLEDHWNEGQVQELISSKKYDFVIIQQGPSSQSEGRKTLLEYGGKYSNLCKSNKAKLCFFMVWPSLDYYHTFNDVIKNYTEAATINKSILLPVGKVWKDYIDSSKAYNYYSSDRFHPSIKGRQVAAKVIVEHLLQ